MNEITVNGSVFFKVADAEMEDLYKWLYANALSSEAKGTTAQEKLSLVQAQV